MRSYSQYCSLAKALDVVGERWTLLIVRELLLRGPSRYTDIRAGLPGIATNLLADRLRQLERAGIVYREEAPPPIATTLFGLTPRGEQLRRVVDELMVWGLPYMADPQPDDVFKPHWLAGPASVFLTDGEPDGPPVQIEVRAGAEPAVIEAAGGGSVEVRVGSAEAPDAIVAGEPSLVMGVLTGALSLREAEHRGLTLTGRRAALRRVSAPVRDPGELPPPGRSSARLGA
jgi:DNA-binding HxlR family transcriptional regulator